MKFSKESIKKIKSNYNRDGYVVIRGLFQKKIINEANQNLWQFLNQRKRHLSKKEIFFTKAGKINSVHNFSKWPYANKLRKNSDLNKIVTSLLGQRSKDFGAELFAKPEKTGLPAPIHQDNYYWCIDNAQALTVWISFGISRKENGGIFYLKKTHKLGLLEHKKSFAPGSSQTLKYPEGLKPFKKVYPNLKAGDCIIHHCLSVHGSDANKSKKSRVGCTLRYISNTSKIDKLMKTKYEKDLKQHYKKI
tara:strand:- start:658 stop:1401 length:744 start_codon:yes stop_codon:yes gene_type:complete